MNEMEGTNESIQKQFIEWILLFIYLSDCIRASFDQKLIKYHIKYVLIYNLYDFFR